MGPLCALSPAPQGRGKGPICELGTRLANTARQALALPRRHSTGGKPRMSHPSTSMTLPAGSIRAGFESAARSHAAVQSGGAVPAARQIAAPRTPVEAAIADAARATSVDFLLAQAEVESAMNPEARAATSSATGLYQFIE